MTKPVIRYRAGKWVCRGAGHQGSSRSPVAAWCAWRSNKTLHDQINRLPVYSVLVAAMGDPTK